jgi:hypothetical protein
LSKLRKFPKVFKTEKKTLFYMQFAASSALVKIYTEIYLKSYYLLKKKGYILQKETNKFCLKFNNLLEFINLK